MAAARLTLKHEVAGLDAAADAVAADIRATVAALADALARRQQQQAEAARMQKTKARRKKKKNNAPEQLNDDEGTKDGGGGGGGGGGSGAPAVQEVVDNVLRDLQRVEGVCS
jgi:hypothetical protein